MKFSIIIPTKDRQMTAEHAVLSCINSNYDDIEVIVSDVSSSPKLAAFIQNLKDPRIKYFHHKQTLSMAENWEFAVGKSNGDYVGIIGDDDALMPDGLLFAEQVLKSVPTEVLKCNSPVYKWPDYPFLNRRNLLTLKVPTLLQGADSPRNILKKAYQFVTSQGTGPGIYHGLISKRFLNELHDKRGKYFVDIVPDFDSGFATLLYADKYLLTTYPIFVSGHCSASNSGAMRFGSLNRKSLQGFSDDLGLDINSIVLDELSDFVSNEIVIVAAMKRFMSEINQALPLLNVEFNSQGAFNYIAEACGGGYEGTKFEADRNFLKRLAQVWSVSPDKIPEKKDIAYGTIADRGVNASSLKGKNVSSIGIDCNVYGVNNIRDTFPIITSMTMDWQILLGRSEVSMDLKRYTPELLIERKREAVDKINKGQNQVGMELLEKIMFDNPADANVAFLIGAQYINLKEYEKSIPFLARSLSLSFELTTFKAYFQALVNTEQFAFLIHVCTNYQRDLENISEQLSEHYFGVALMHWGNYSLALEHFSRIARPYDEAIQNYCEAQLCFATEDFSSALEAISKACSLQPNNLKYKEFEQLVGKKLKCKQ